jgi:oligopeptide transport system ATP-binding protein
MTPILPAKLPPLSDRSGPSDQAVVMEVRDLCVDFGRHAAVDHVSFNLRPGETVALVGESGCGKTTTGMALMGLVSPRRSCRVRGQIRLHTKAGAIVDVNAMAERERRAMRGNEVAMIFQDPMSSLNPVYSVGSQICETITLHQGCASREAQQRAAAMLDSLGIPAPEQCMSNYPHQISGGMRQRVMIAIALSCQPGLLIADEPTTSLDVTIQAQIIDLLAHIQKQTGMAMLFITHNLGIVAQLARRLMVMYDGQIVESGDASIVLRSPLMPYTRSLLAAVPRFGRSRRQGFRLEAIAGQLPGPGERRVGCRFSPRCTFVEPELCNQLNPPLEEVGPAHFVRCLRWPCVHRVKRHG